MAWALGEVSDRSNLISIGCGYPWTDKLGIMCRLGPPDNSVLLVYEGQDGGLKITNC